MSDINKDAPHESIVLITVKIHERNQLGQVLPIPVEKMTRVLTIKGHSFEDTKEKTEKFLQEITSENNKKRIRKVDGSDKK